LSSRVPEALAPASISARSFSGKPRRGYRRDDAPAVVPGPAVVDHGRSRGEQEQVPVSKIIVITGAGSGLGRALARRFAADGETVVLLGRTLGKLQAVADEIGARAMAVQCDVGVTSSVRAAFATIAARFPQIDVLINNAAAVGHFEVAEATDDQVEACITTNLTGPVLCTRAAIPLLANGGHIFNVSSGAVDQAFPGLTLYGATKAGLERFSLSLHQELAPQGIKVTVVRCGQMVDADHSWDSPAMAERAALAAAHGLDPRKRASSQFASVTDAFRALLDLPPDLCSNSITLRPRAAT
jgi:meso-butanediol dehydrogenase/(S,S)-butanediol dehydrogenase/diacetyl reductase